METKKINKKRWSISIMLLLIFGVGFWCYFNQVAKRDQYQANALNAMQSSMQQYRNALGQQVTKRQVLQIAFKDLQGIHASDSSEIGQLKKLVKGNTQSAVIFTVATTGTLTGGKPDVTYGTKTDSLTKATVVDSCNPVIKDTLQDQWATMFVKASKNSINVEYTITNEFTATHTIDKTGNWPFRKETLNITLTNKNPHTVTKNILGYSKPLPDNKKRNTVITILTAAGAFALGVCVAK